MSRFDDFAKSRAEGRGLFSALKRTRPGAELDGESGVSRRDLMKKAGLVTGAAVVGSTLIQSVTAPAFATSHCTTPADNGRGCGATCGAGNTCPNGSTCALPSDCTSGFCTAGVCTPTVPPISNGGACGGGLQQAKDASCQSGYCGSNGLCATPNNTQASLNGTCHGTSQATANNNCVSTQTCSGWTVVSGSGTCKVKDSENCSPAGNSANCASGTCSGTGNGSKCLKSTGASCTNGNQCASTICLPNDTCA